MKKLILIPILFLSLNLIAQYVVVKPSQLPEANVVNTTDLFILNQGQTTKKLKYSTLINELVYTFPTISALGDSCEAIRASSGSGTWPLDSVNYASKYSVSIKKDKSDSTQLSGYKTNYAFGRDLKPIQNYLSNGVKTGFTISINVNPSKINISSGTGNVVINTDASNPIFIPVVYGGATAVSITNIATANATYLAVDSVGTIVQQTTNFTPAQRRRYIVIGAAIHSNRVTVNAVNNLPDIALDGMDQFNDFLDALRGFNISGNIISANGANLSINKSLGYIFKKGANFNTANSNPHWLQLPSLTAPSNIRYRLRDGTEYSNTNVIEPDSFDNAGARTIVPVNDFTIQRITLFSSNLIRIQFGQATYGSMALAIQAIQTENFVTESNIADNGLLRALLVVRRGTTNLQSTTDAKFFEVDRFGGVQATAGGGGTTTLQQSYNNSTQPQITTSTTGGELQIKRGSSSDTDTVLSVLNGSNATTFDILGNGKTNATKFEMNSLTDTSSMTATQLPPSKWVKDYVSAYAPGFVSGSFLKAPGVPYQIADTAGVSKTALYYDGSGLRTDTSLTISNNGAESSAAISAASENNIGIYAYSTNLYGSYSSSLNSIGSYVVATNGITALNVLGGKRYYAVFTSSNKDSILLYSDAKIQIKTKLGRKFEADSTGKQSLMNGSDSIILNPASGIRLYGNATTWDDLNFNPLSSGGASATLPDYVTINNTIHREFTSANNQLCGDVRELPHPYKLSSNLTPHCHIFLKSGESAGTTGVTFTFYWELRQTTGTTSGSLTLSATSTQLTDNAHKFDIAGTSFAGSAELGGQLSVTIARTAGDAGDVVLLTYGVHYEIDALGSNLITTK